MNALFAGEMALKWFILAIMFFSLYRAINKLPKKLKIIFFGILGSVISFILIMAIFFPETLIYYNNQVLSFRKENGFYWRE